MRHFHTGGILEYISLHFKAAVIDGQGLSEFRKWFENTNISKLVKRNGQLALRNLEEHNTEGRSYRYITETEQ